jgi:hypothetical protein
MLLIFSPFNIKWQLPHRPVHNKILLNINLHLLRTSPNIIYQLVNCSLHINYTLIGHTRNKLDKILRNGLAFTDKSLNNFGFLSKQNEAGVAH